MLPTGNSRSSRRHFLTQASGGSLAATLMASSSTLSAGQRRGTRRILQGKAEACIFIWLGGGASQVDMWDPKRRGDAQRRIAGSDYDSIRTAVPGVQVCEHLRHSAELMDRIALVRTVHHNVNEHAAAVNRMHTGRPTTGTILYPSVGSVVSHKRGQVDPNVPAYVLIGYPNVARGPGFLGGRAGYVYLTETEVGPNGLTPPAGVSSRRQRRRQALLARMQQQQLQRNAGETSLADYVAVSQQGFRMAGPNFMNAFQLTNEPAGRRQRYGGEFGQRCLLARRLVESGVRFVEVSFNLNFVNGTGWDTHRDGQENQHVLIRDLDKAFSALILDLERVRKLDTTLLVIATEFGRPPEFDSGGGRGHQPGAFTVVLAGGGLRTGRAIGATNDRGNRIANRPVAVPDLHATIYSALGIDPHVNLRTADARPVPITDGGTPIRELFS
ncbi:MAG: DUF1501 domain-containing protein [Gemmataceae bacterium]